MLNKLRELSNKLKSKLKSMVFDFICKFVDKKKLTKALENFHTTRARHIAFKERWYIEEICVLLVIIYLCCLFKISTQPLMVEYATLSVTSPEDCRLYFLNGEGVLRMNNEYYFLSTLEWHTIAMLDLFNFLNSLQYEGVFARNQPQSEDILSL